MGLDSSCGVDGSCSSHGSCISNQCSCQQGWSGFDCEVPSETPCPLSCSGKGTCSSSGVCACISGYYGSGCEYSFCAQETIKAESGTVFDRTANSPFPMMTAKPCSWIINVTADKLASVALELLHDTSQRFMALFVDGAFNTAQVMDMPLKDLAPLVLATTFPVNMMNSLQSPNLLRINCSDAHWAGGKSCL